MYVVTLARKPPHGSIVSMVRASGCGALNILASRIPYMGESDMTLTVGRGDPGELNPGAGAHLPSHKENWGKWEVTRAGRWPSNMILGSSEVALGLDEQSGVRRSTWTGASEQRGSEARPVSKFRPDQGEYMPQGPLYADTGGASRFFKVVQG